MKALVTGSAGFVGRHLIDHLEEHDDEVSGTDVSTGGPNLLDLEGLVELFKETGPEVIFHLAGQLCLLVLHLPLFNFSLFTNRQKSH